MRARCIYPNHHHYRRYGGRGITVCERWVASDGFPRFLEDVGLAPSPLHTLGRIDNDGPYDPANVEWQLPKEQANNKSFNRRLILNGVTKTLQQWADLFGIKSHTLAARIDRHGWKIERAITEPLRFKGSYGERFIKFRGEIHNLSEWSRITGIKMQTIRQRVETGWSPRRALTVDPMKYHHRTK